MFNFFKKNPRDKIIKHIGKTFSKEVSKILIENLATSFVLDNINDKKLETGISKQSGYPDLPLDFQWPECNGRKLDFILQLNLSAFEGDKIGLPQKGILYFFLDIINVKKFPRAKNEYKVIYLSDWDELQQTSYEKHNQVKEKPLVIRETLTFPETEQSYLLKDVDLTDDEFDELINLDYPIVSDLFGGGIFDVGKLSDSDVINEWVESFNQDNDKQLNAEESTHKFTCLLSFLLDEWGFADSWIHFGIENEDLENIRFENTKIAFTSS